MSAQAEVEIWESTIAGTLFIQVHDPRRKGEWRPARVSGKGTGNSRLKLTRDEREFNQEMIPERNAGLDPFTNGALVCISGRPADEAKSRYELTDTDLLDLLAITDDTVFTEALEGTESELVIRRLLDLAEKHSTVARYSQVRDLVEDRYKCGGTQRTVQEMIDAGERIGATMMS